jgi:flagellar protein FliO/FliZ
MNLLDSLFGTEVPLVAKMLIAFGVIFGLLALLWIVGRRFVPGPKVAGGANRNRQPRLGVLDAHAVDARRKLVLIRRDNVEHLIMIGGPNDVVIESTILRGRPQVRPAPPSQGAVAVERAAPERPRPGERPLPVERPAAAERAVAAERGMAEPMPHPAPAPPPERQAPVVPERTPPRTTERQAAAVERAQQARQSAAAAAAAVRSAPARAIEAEMASRLEDALRRPAATAPAQPSPVQPHPARPAWAMPERRTEAPRPAQEPEEASPAIDTAELEASLFAEEGEELKPAPHRNGPVFERPAPVELRGSPPARGFAEAALRMAPLPRPAPVPDTRMADLRAPEPRDEPTRPQDVRPAEPRAEDAVHSEFQPVDGQRPEPGLDIVPDRMTGAAFEPVDSERRLEPVGAASPQAAERPAAAPRALGPLPTFSVRPRPEPREEAARPEQPRPEPRLEPAPAPQQAAEPAAEARRAPEAEPEPPRPVSQDPFASLEEEMASLLGRIPGGGSKP